MKKILIVEDNHSFITHVEEVVAENFPDCAVIVFSKATEAVNSINFANRDFDILLLDGDLGNGGSGDDVLKILTPPQLLRTIVCSGDSSFIKKASTQGVKVFLDKGFRGIRATMISAYTLETLKKI